GAHPARPDLTTIQRDAEGVNSGISVLSVPLYIHRGPVLPKPLSSFEVVWDYLVHFIPEGIRVVEVVEMAKLMNHDVVDDGWRSLPDLFRHPDGKAPELTGLMWVAEATASWLADSLANLPISSISQSSPQKKMCRITPVSKLVGQIE
ncbi:MAG: hypothetical protein WD696_20510, partial [Bryobacteraceae bacterium]